MTFTPERVVVWFSCGVTSAVAAKLTVEKYKDRLPISIVYTDPGAEHPDNTRFMADCEKWFGHPITTPRSEKYEDIWDVFRKTKYLVGVQGARCTAELKKKLRQDFQQVWSDIQVFGFDAGESKRADRFRGNNPEVHLETPLIDRNLSKADCLALLRKVGIELPEMYKLGYLISNATGTETTNFKPSMVLEAQSEIGDTKPASFKQKDIAQILPKLQDKRIIYKTGYGEYAYAVPMFRDFVLRQYDVDGGTSA